MAGVVEQQATFARNIVRAGQLGLYAVVGFGESGLGELQFQFAEDFDGGEDLVGFGADPLSHFEQDAVNLGQLFFEQAYELVVLLDGLQGLDEYRLAAGAGTVNYALDAAFLLDLTGMTKRSPRMVMSSS